VGSGVGNRETAVALVGYSIYYEYIILILLIRLYNPLINYLNSVILIIITKFILIE